MKKKLQFILQKLMGFRNYLFIFSLFKILTLKYVRYESDFFYFLKLLRKDAIVLDIGANIGIMTILLAKELKGGFVYAFEPVSYSYYILNKVVRFFGYHNVKTFKIALGDETKMIKMVMPIVKGVKMQGLSHVTNSCDKDVEVGIYFDVEQKKLDDIDELKSVYIKRIKS